MQYQTLDHIQTETLDDMLDTAPSCSAVLFGLLEARINEGCLQVETVWLTYEHSLNERIVSLGLERDEELQEQRV